MTAAATTRALDRRAVALGVAAQWVHVLALFVATPLEGALVGSVLLVLATGVVGGLVAGDRVGPPPSNSGRHGLLAGVGGGVGTAGLFWWAMVTPSAPRGAFWSLAYIVATAPVPWTRTHGEFVVAGVGLALGCAVAALAWAAGRRAPRRAESVVEWR